MLHLSERGGGAMQEAESDIHPPGELIQMKAGGPALQSYPGGVVKCSHSQRSECPHFYYGRPAELLSSEIISIHTQIAGDGCFIGAALLLTKREASTTRLSIVTVNGGWILVPSRENVTGLALASVPECETSQRQTWPIVVNFNHLN